ncbi:MAG: hypothetical protein HY471_00380 [Candidatus Sungbacteria bacterium]|nr:hypothetical protein [Candidatus Sungbacteria bacterium]
MRHILKRVGGSLYVVVGLVLIWRGVWVALDWIEYYFFGYETVGVAVLSIAVGLVLLFLHDHKIDELGHL